MASSGLIWIPHVPVDLPSILISPTEKEERLRVNLLPTVSRLRLAAVVGSSDGPVTLNGDLRGSHGEAAVASVNVRTRERCPDLLSSH